MSTPAWVKIHVSVMAQKNGNENCQKEGANFFSENFFFDPKFSKNLYFSLFLVKNSVNLVSLKGSIDVGMHVIAQNDHSTILLKWANFFFSKIFLQKFKKSIFGPKNGKK